MSARIRAGSRHHTEHGGMLIEVIMAVTVLTILAAPIASAAILGLRLHVRTASLLDQSHGRSMLTALFTADVQGAGGDDRPPSKEGVVLADTLGCGGSALVSFTWIGDLGARETVSYAIEAEGAPVRRALVRRACSNGALEARVTIIDDVGPHDPVFSCMDGALCPGLLLRVKDTGGSVAYLMHARRRVT